mmetsp:Transcript_58871/g.49840  ORF Transcript_58871/g.49840 Transcript_58871/m.49840 type:complete len:337 (+) Transcript_58871:663-1673(+)
MCHTRSEPSLAAEDKAAERGDAEVLRPHAVKLLGEGFADLVTTSGDEVDGSLRVEAFRIHHLGHHLDESLLVDDTREGLVERASVSAGIVRLGKEARMARRHAAFAHGLEPEHALNGRVHCVQPIVGKPGPANNIASSINAEGSCLQVVVNKDRAFSIAGHTNRRAVDAKVIHVGLAPEQRQQSVGLDLLAGRELNSERRRAGVGRVAGGRQGVVQDDFHTAVLKLAEKLLTSLGYSCPGQILFEFCAGGDDKSDLGTKGSIRPRVLKRGDLSANYGHLLGRVAEVLDRVAVENTFLGIIFHTLCLETPGACGHQHLVGLDRAIASARSSLYSHLP